MVINTESRIKPNLFVIGAAKCATTSLHDYLNSHPQIVMSTEKEPQYFLEPQLHEPCLRPARGSTETSRTLYLKLFPGIETKSFAGESSTHYTFLPINTGVADRIFQFNPESRFIYIVRDPVERALSHYFYCCQIGYELDQSPLAAFRRDPMYCAVSYYAMQLQEYLRLFRQDQIYVMTFEDLSDQPAETMARLFEWLQLPVPPDHSAELYSDRKNATSAVYSQRRTKTPWKLRKSRVFGVIRRLVPKRMRQGVWEWMTTSSLSRRQVRRSEVDVGPAVEFLQKLQLPQVQEFEALCGRTFPQWKTVRGGTACREPELTAIGADTAAAF